MVFLILWFGFILIVSVMPVSGPKTDLPADKIAHFVFYGITSIFLFRHFVKKAIAVRAFFMSVILASTYGAAMEVVQHFLPYRSFSLEDMVANILGAFSGCLLYMKGKSL
jgi:VanZ family protein